LSSTQAVARKCFIAESDTDAPEALIAGGQTLLSPDLIVPEVCNVAGLKLCR
jgi:hypothetical protein